MNGVRSSSSLGHENTPVAHIAKKSMQFADYWRLLGDRQNPLVCQFSPAQS